MAHSSQHEVIAVAMRARDGRLEAFVSRVERRDDESLESALGRAVDVTALAHVEQLETRVLRNGALARPDGHRAPGRSGGRPAALFRFASRRLEVTDEFAALRPPR